MPVTAGVAGAGGDAGGPVTAVAGAAGGKVLLAGHVLGAEPRHFSLELVFVDFSLQSVKAHPWTSFGGQMIALLKLFGGEMIALLTGTFFR